MAETIGDRIKLVRRMYGLTQHELAKRTGFGQTYISYLEHNKAYPDVKFLRAMNEKFGCDYLWLIDGIAANKNKLEIVRKLTEHLSELSQDELETLTNVMDAYINSIIKQKRKEKQG